MVSRKLDAAIAEALGYEVRLMGENSFYYNTNKDYWTHSGDRIWHKVSAYSTDGNAMLELIKEAAEKGVVMDGIYYCNGETKEYVVSVFNTVEATRNEIDGMWPYMDVGKKMPIAVALAIYHALTGKEWTSID